MSLAPLFELSTQFQAKNGRNNTAGFLRVFLAGTDDPAVTYSDYNGTLNTRDIYLDDDGRAVVICDNTKAYRLEVYDASGMLMWTEEPIWCTGSGGGGTGTVTDIVSQDGSIVVSETTVGQVTTFDLSIAPDSSEMLEWVETENTGVSDGTVIPGFVDGTMEVVGGQGLFLQANEMYHVTNSFTVTPVGNGINYDTLNVKLMLDSTELCSRSYDVDNSLNDTVECEFSYDVSTTADGYLYWIVSGASAFSNVDAKMQLHRIYSGIAAVPSTYATKTYVDSGLSSRIAYSALEFNTGSQITGISGSAIGAAGVDPNEFVPWSASGVFQPSGDYVSATDFSACCSSMSAAVSSISSDLSSLSGVVSGLTGTYLEQSAFSAYTSTALTGLQQDTADISAAVSAITGQTGNYIPWSASGQFQPSGDYADQSAFTSYTSTALTGLQQDTADISAAVSAITGQTGNYIDWSASGQFQPSGNYVDQSAFDDCCSSMSAAVSSVSADVSALSGIASGIQQDTADISAAVSAITGQTGNYIDWSASGVFQPSGNYASASDLANYLPNSAIEGSGGKVTGISGSAIKGHEYTGIFPVSVDNTSDTISVANKTLAVDDTMTGYESAGSAIIGVNTANVLSGLTAYQPSGDYAYNSALSSKLDSSALELSGDWVSGVELSGSSFRLYASWAAEASMAQTACYDSDGHYLSYVANAVEGNSASWNEISAKQDASAMSGYQTIDGMSAYQPSGDYAYNSALSAKLDTTAFSTVSGDFLTSHQSLAGYATESYVDSSVSGKLDATASSQFITSLPADLAYTSDVASAVSGKMDKSESSSFYPMDSNPSGYLTAHQSLAGYATESYVDSSVSSKVDSSAYDSAWFQLASAMTAYQLSGDYAYNSAVSGKQDISGMTAYQPVGDYQPSGDYIYASSLGTGTI